MEEHRYLVYYGGGMFEVEIITNGSGCMIRVRKSGVTFRYSLVDANDVLSVDVKLAEFVVTGTVDHHIEIELFLNDLENILRHGMVLGEEHRVI